MDKEKRIKVCFVAHALSNHGGAALSLYNLISSIVDKVDPILIACEDGPILQRLRDMGVRCFVLGFQLLMLPRFAIQDYRVKFPYLFVRYKIKEHQLVSRIAKELADEDIEIVHSNSSVFSFGHALAKRLKAKHVWHIREFLDLDFGLEVFGSRKRLIRLINKADARISISSGVAKHWKLKEKDTFIIWNAIRKGTRSTFIKDKQKYILFCAANITIQKGAHFAVEAFANSGISNSGYTLHFYGRCDENVKLELQDIAKTYGVQDAIEFFEFADDLDDVYANATAYLMSSMYEGLGRVTIEAMFQGCPVIARHNGGSLDLIKDGVTGYFFNDIDSCASLIKRVVSQDNTKLIVEAQKFANENFTESVYRVRILEVYDKLVAKK